METAEANPNDRPVSGPSEGAGEKAEGEAGAELASKPVTARGRGPLAVLRHREFALFWAGQAVSLVGSWMQGFAQGWVVTNLTKEAFALGLVNFAMALPTLVLMPLGGVAADRFDRRAILLYTQWVLLVLAAVTGVLVYQGRLELWHVYLLALPLGIATAYELPAYQSFYPQLIEKEELPQAISLNQATFHGSRIIGPAVAGWMIALWGTASAFFANAASFLAVIVALGMIRPRRPAPGLPHTSAGAMMKEGVRYVRDRPQIVALLGLTGITTFCIFPNLAVLTPYYARQVLQVGAGGLGILMSVSGAGSLLGAALLLSTPPAQRVNRIALCTGVILVSMSLLAWAPGLWLAVPAIGLQSVAIAHSLGLASIIVQELAEDHIRGRVMALYTMMFTGVMPFAALLVTKLVDEIGMRIELQAAGILYFTVSLLLVARLRRLPS